MQETVYQTWLERRETDPGTLRSRMSTLRRIEGVYGDLDAAFDADGLGSVLETLEYSGTDARSKAPNPSQVEINGDLYSGLASLRSHLRAYAHYRTVTLSNSVVPDTGPFDASPDGGSGQTPEGSATFRFERDMQANLRASISDLDPTLTIIDSGAEQRVPSGKIDILARDPDGTRVVIELKAVTASREAVGQILSYMGDLSIQGDAPLRGLLIAPDFDHRALAAARMVSELKLIRYRVKFAFSDAEEYL